MCCMTSRSTHLSTWGSSDLKHRFADAAARQGLSESAFLKRLVERALAGTDSVSASVLPSAWRSRNSEFGERWSALMDTCERGWIFEHNLAAPGPAHCGGPVRE